MTAPPLPELTDAVVDGETIDRLFADLGALTEVQHVIGRVRRGEPVSTDPLALEDAHAQLRSGALVGVQVLYQWEGRQWRDAIMAVPGGFRVVRMRAG